MLRKISNFFEKNAWSMLMLIVAVIIWSVKLQAQVNANEYEMQEKGATLRQDFETYANKLDAVRDSQIRMEKDIEYIRKAVEDAPIVYEVE